MSKTVIEQAKEDRKLGLVEIEKSEWDYVIIGAGITGSQVFRVLTLKGKKVLLMDAGDFSSGTSSNSGMLIWGGLLYLKHLDFKSVFSFSRSRDRLIKKDTCNVKVMPVTYLTDKRKLHASIALWLYWLISLFRRKAPFQKRSSSGEDSLQRKYRHRKFFEEAIIRTSDSRYVLNVILHSLKQCARARAFNYLAVTGGQYCGSHWDLQLYDKINERHVAVKAKNVINCAGVGADTVNDLLGMQDSPYRHLWSKGVYLNLARDSRHKAMYIFDDPEKNDVMTYCPVGDVSLFGPTEDNIDLDKSVAGRLTRDDITQLKRKYEACTGKALSRQDIVSFRMGVRPLCVPSHQSHDKHTLSISRQSRIYHDPGKHYAAVYGGKFTGSYSLAKRVVNSFGVRNIPAEQGIEMSQVGIIEPVKAVLDEQCWTLKDYLRNRTFVNQSVHNGGFGENFEFKEKLETLSSYFMGELSSLDVSINAYLEEQLQLNRLFNEVLDVS